MKSFLFVSDFDGTATMQDFYHQILYRYEHEKLFSRFFRFRKGEFTCFSFLSEVFRDMNLTKDELDCEIAHIPLDPGFAQLVDAVKRFGGEVVLLSAGSSYYINRKLEMEGITGVRVISNPAVYQNGGLYLTRDESSPFDCEQMGIDKEKVLLSFRKDGRTIAYAGDGWPDFEACALSDIRFARRGKRLESMLKEKGLDFFSFDTFFEIHQILKELAGSQKEGVT